MAAEVNGQNPHTFADAVSDHDRKWSLSVSVQEADNERWRRAEAVLLRHPLLTFYTFARSAAEHAVHPSPDVLSYARLNFYCDYFVLALLWGGLLALAILGYLCKPNPAWDDGGIDQPWLLSVLLICGLLTLSSGISFGAGSRLRAPLEAIVPLLAAMELMQAIRVFSIQPQQSKKAEQYGDLLASSNSR